MVRRQPEYCRLVIDACASRGRVRSEGQPVYRGGVEIVARGFLTAAIRDEIVRRAAADRHAGR